MKQERIQKAESITQQLIANYLIEEAQELSIEY